MGKRIKKSNADERIIVTVNEDYSNNYNFLNQVPGFVMHNDPRYCESSEYGLSTNFDILIDTDITPSPYRDRLVADGKYIDARRVGKSAQFLQLQAAGIETLPWVSNKSGSTIPTVNAIGGVFNPTEMVVIKRQHGARGGGQVKLKAVDIGKFIDDVGHSTDEELKTLYEEGATWLDIAKPKGDGFDQFRQLVRECHDTIIQKYVKFEAEYRIIFNGCGHMLGVERAKKSDWQVTGVDGILRGNEDELIKIFGSEFIMKLDKFFREDLSLPFGSIDIYSRIDENGDRHFGVLEFCPQFGISGPYDIEELNALLVAGLKNAIDNIKA